MKVVFPCSGSIVLLKRDLETLKAFYNTSMMTSKLGQMQNSITDMVQLGHLNYVPKQTKFVLYKANVLTIEQMRKILGIYKEPAPQPTPQSSNEEIEAENQKPISDNDILSNTFFKTLTPLN